MFAYFGVVAFVVAVQGANDPKPCSTFLGARGECISIYYCTPIFRLVALPSQFVTTRVQMALRNSQCGFEGGEPQVCCPTDVPRVPVAKPQPPIPTVAPSLPNVTNHPNLRLLDRKYCGSFTEQKITGGRKTSVLQFPWMALIAYNVDKLSTEFKCGGSLINKRYVLTAAHCVTELQDNGIVLVGVRVGEHNLDKERDCDQERGVPTVCADKYQNFFVESVHVHAGYNKKRHENDIALIRMDGDANFEASNVKPICLPYKKSEMLTAKRALVTGWGVTEKGEQSEELLQVKLNIVPNDKCAKIYKKHYRVEVTQKQICAEGKNMMDSCTGDSGGPLQWISSIEGVPKYVQYGIVSFGPMNCGAPGYPGVYTKVAYYMDWILDTITE